MIRPAPIFICPTSELPICPSGRPTASPLAFPFTNGHSAISLSITGVFASATALPSVLSLNPYPSKIINTVGFLLIPKSPLHLDCLIINSTAYCTSFSTILQDRPPNKYIRKITGFHSGSSKNHHSIVVSLTTRLTSNIFFF